MTVYVDILIFINTVIDFLLLSLTAFSVKEYPAFKRKIAAAFVSALFSLYIFLPPLGFFVELIMRLTSSAAAVFICFGFKNFRRSLRIGGLFYAASFLFAGLMAGCYMLFEPDNMSLNNGVVYFNISPLVLITVSFVFYLTIILFKKLFKKDASSAKRYTVTLWFRDNTAVKTAFADTGHSLNDIFGNSVMLFIDRSTAFELFGESETDLLYRLQPPETDILRQSLRVIPVKTVAGERLMSAVKIDRAELETENGKKTLIKPVAILADERLGEDYSVILPTDIFEV